LKLEQNNAKRFGKKTLSKIQQIPKYKAVLKFPASIFFDFYLK
jgi:hypothetical protein